MGGCPGGQFFRDIAQIRIMKSGMPMCCEKNKLVLWTA